MLVQDRQAVLAAERDVRSAASEPAALTPFGAAQQAMRQSVAAYRFRDAIRQEQAIVYRLAGDNALAAEVLGQPAADAVAGLQDAIAGLTATWRASGITDPQLVRPRQSRRFLSSEPVDALLGYYQAAGAASGIDWTHLAAINYIESDFGRTLGPSAAGALGPMQFLPSTWAEVGGGGDIMSPHDSIFGAARFLRRAGAPGDYHAAIFSYNNDNDYVEGVQRLAAAIRADPLWLSRLYYWNTYG
jgi:membrane-bound lytic murein transglycosylase B